MLGRISAWTLFVCSVCIPAAGAWAIEDDIQAGRARMFEGGVAGFAEAYQIFDAALAKEDKPNAADNRELLFLHALTRTVVLFHDYPDVVSAERFVTLAEEFGISLAQSTLADCRAVLSPSGTGSDGRVPNGMGPTLRDFVQTELSDIVAELDSIADTPTPFTVCFTPQETGLAAVVEVDYGEVLILKALVLAYQAVLEADPERTRPDGCLAASVLDTETTAVATETDLVAVVDGCLHDALCGQASPPVVAQDAERLADGIGCFLDAIDYMFSEDLPAGADPQEDELLYLGPDARMQMEPVLARLQSWRESVPGGSVTSAARTSLTYDLCDANGLFLGELVLTQDSLDPEGYGGRLTLNDGTVLDIEWMEVGLDNAVVMDLRGRNVWRQAWFEGIFSADRDGIANVTIDCWGQGPPTVTRVTGRRTPGGTIPTLCDAGERMSDASGFDPYRAYRLGLFEAP